MVANQVVRQVRGVGLGFWSGFTYPFRGMGFVYVRHPGLVRYWIWPILIVIAMIVGSVVVASHYDSVLTARVMGSDSLGMFEFGRALGRVLATAVFFVLLFAAGVAATILLSPVIAAPFNDMLSEEVERVVSGRDVPPFSFARLVSDVARTVRVELSKLLLYAAVMGPLIVLSIFVAPLSAVTSVLGFLFTAVYFAIDYVDWPASRRARGVRARVAMLRRNPLVMLGFGCGVWLFLFIPFVQLFFMPAAVAGGTLLFLALEPPSDGPVESAPAPPEGAIVPSE